MAVSRLPRKSKHWTIRGPDYAQRLRRANLCVYTPLLAGRTYTEGSNDTAIVDTQDSATNASGRALWRTTEATDYRLTTRHEEHRFTAAGLANGSARNRNASKKHKRPKNQT